MYCLQALCSRSCSNGVARPSAVTARLRRSCLWAHKALLRKSAAFPDRLALDSGPASWVRYKRTCTRTALRASRQSIEFRWPQERTSRQGMYGRWSAQRKQRCCWWWLVCQAPAARLTDASVNQRRGTGHESHTSPADCDLRLLRLRLRLRPRLRSKPSVVCGW